MNETPLPPLRFSLREWTGALGDVAVLVPLFLAMDRTIEFPLARSLLLVGLFYIWSGLYYRIPVPVQPLKAMAAAVLAGGFPFEVVRFAGLLVALVLLMGTRFAGALERLFSRATTKGVQFGLGLILVRTGWQLLVGAETARRAVPSSTGEAILWAVVLLAIPQIPLTLGNSIFACADAAKTYFGPAARRVSPRALLTDLGVVNLGASIFGAYPLCHGSGGLTAHYAFGGRTGGTAVLAGLLYLVLSLTGSVAKDFLAVVPNALLGISLLYIGIAHAMLLRSLKRRSEWFTAIAGGLVGGLTGNLAWSLAIGWLAQSLTGIFRAMRPEHRL